MGIFDVFNTKTVCECGKKHSLPAVEVIKGKNAVDSIVSAVKSIGGKKPFIFADKNTYAVAGDKVCNLLRSGGMDYSCYVFGYDEIEPDEKSVGSVIMHMDNSCDCIIAIGSGVLNDIGKIISLVSRLPYIIVGTAPSMDGYASSSSSVIRDGVKYSLSSRCPDVIIGDTDILKTAPVHMLKSGLGDMIAKFNSICEWKISNVINGEYYCDATAQIVKQALKKCTDNAGGLLEKKDDAIEAVFDGLILCGVAMSYVNVSRPASGVEHYISHVWDMHGVEVGKKVDLHGIQCAVGTRIAVKIYQMLKTYTPNRDKALDFVNSFDYNAHAEKLRSFLGIGGESMIALEAKEGKYDKQKHAKRLETIIARWDDIVKIIDEELPSLEQIDSLFDTIELAKTPGEIGEDDSLLPLVFSLTKDIRDKYVLSRLVWDLGIIDELKF